MALKSLPQSFHPDHSYTWMIRIGLLKQLSDQFMQAMLNGHTTENMAYINPILQKRKQRAGKTEKLSAYSGPSLFKQISHRLELSFSWIRSE